MSYSKDNITIPNQSSVAKAYQEVHDERVQA